MISNDQNGGILRALKLEDWYNNLSKEQQEKARRYSSDGENFTQGVYTPPYGTQKDFLFEIAKGAFGADDFYYAIFLAKEGLRPDMEGSESIRVQLYDILIRGYSKLEEWKRVKEYCFEELGAFPNVKDFLESIYRNGYILCVEVLWNIVRMQAITSEDITEAETTLDLLVSKGFFTREEAKAKLKDLRNYLKHSKPTYLG